MRREMWPRTTFFYVRRHRDLFLSGAVGVLRGSLRLTGFTEFTRFPHCSYSGFFPLYIP